MMMIVCFPAGLRIAVLRLIRRPRAALPSCLAVLLLLPILAACEEGNANKPEGGAPPPTPVSVIEVAPEALPIVNELPGRIAPTRIAEVRPRVSGIVVERVFQQGSSVQEGDPLYRIDPEPFRLQVQRAEATLQRAEASAQQARQQADRQKELRNRKVASAQRYDDAIATLAQANADVALAKASLAAAKLDLEYAVVKAPISGRIGRAAVTEGALVVANAVLPLAVIRQLDPVYADITQSANELLQLRRAVESGAVAGAATPEGRADSMPAQLLFDDGTPYDIDGRLLFSEATVDSSTGQIVLRGEFPNPKGELLPGMYVRVRLVQGTQNNALAVPKQAVQRDLGGNAQVYVVDGDGKAAVRRVTAGRVVGESWVIDEGLSAGDRVIVEGFQKIRPGAPVTPEPWKPGSVGQAGAEDAGTAAAAGGKAG
ncbi:efflux RND transporter periplasmic adaptor subunit [Marinibaculum pumilum]|uniref:Efflux RND transporter periplasmic adaptor subunit n=1 Tax=Marinibaculum pumilum TaxID=1766165 RepID=A0ABV7L321_9PROT